MASELKTKANDSDVSAFIEAVGDPRRQQDARQLLELMREASGHEPQMWGSSIVGFGSYHYKNVSGREGDWMLTGFSPRKRNLTVYIMPGFSDFETELAKLGKHKIAKSCLYLNRLSDVDKNVLETIVRRSVDIMRKRYDAP